MLLCSAKSLFYYTRCICNLNHHIRGYFFYRDNNTIVYWTNIKLKLLLKSYYNFSLKLLIFHGLKSRMDIVRLWSVGSSNLFPWYCLCVFPSGCYFSDSWQKEDWNLQDLFKRFIIITSFSTKIQDYCGLLVLYLDFIISYFGLFVSFIEIFRSVQFALSRLLINSCNTHLTKNNCMT